ncbi:MAG: tRNA (adenosine(37)-N6)-threonylcarbamoyltransferase complex dimerization subunit type 1 TsaB [Candidatus Omnitrophica bacterium]|nr:tRNA (adenosine(37)-N6)-threonylcarbamoyltransferase complex dimerization subunit type 1 TsaB [Candidatus Omnitrophota bacterium]
MKILAIETSTKHLSLAVTEGDTCLATRNVRPQKDLSMTVTFDIERVLAKAALSLSDLDGFVVGIGPGSFTSLRVGLSMIKAFVMVTEKPVVGIPSLDVLAMNIRSKKPVQICTINDARRNLVYACLYEKKDGNLTRKCAHLLEPLAEVLKNIEGDVTFVGDAVAMYHDQIMAEAAKKRFNPKFEPEKHSLPKAAELARLGYQRLLKGDFDKVETLTPLYLYPEDCQVSRKT